MNTSLSHLPPDKQTSLASITRVIKKAVNPEKIILFNDPAESSSDLLVITRPGETRQEFEIQDILSNRCHPHGPCTFIIHDIQQVNQYLCESQLFFYNIIKEAILLYDAGTMPLADPAPPDLTRHAENVRRGFHHRFGQAKAFFKSARFNERSKEYPLAMFLLHQAAEHAYRAILYVLIGYEPKTHNLDKLRRYTDRFSEDLAHLFPCSTDKETRLFRRLVNAYLDTRYKDEYSIAQEQLHLLRERVRGLHSIAERLCQGHLASC